jgi:GMP synthase-like glutamine amidotransferase
MLRAVVLKHVTFEGPARIAELLAARGCSIEIRELYRGDRVPSRLEPDELLIVMGGPMGVADVGSPEFPFLRDELELLRRCVAADAPVLGVCLGAQLLAAAAGAVVAPMRDGSGARVYEVGWSPLELHAGDAVLAGVPARPTVLHWHGDACELPSGARLLASTPVCKTQAFALGTRQFGLQFHCEVDTPHVLEFLRVDAEFVARANGPDGVERIRRDTERHIAGLRAAGDRLLGNMLDAMTDSIDS